MCACSLMCVCVYTHVHSAYLCGVLTCISTLFCSHLLSPNQGVVTIFHNNTVTFLTVIIPSWVSWSVMTSNISCPSPSVMLYSISAFSPMSASLALILPIGVPGGEDSGVLNWYVPIKHQTDK